MMENVDCAAHDSQLYSEMGRAFIILVCCKLLGAHGAGVTGETTSQNALGIYKVGPRDPNHDVEIAFGQAARNGGRADMQYLGGWWQQRSEFLLNCCEKRLRCDTGRVGIGGECKSLVMGHCGFSSLTSIAHPPDRA